ncbi:MAG: hypothetical protein PHE01_02270 [Methanosarcina sp.]|nr:hypothetical protein [Methanosarcina sp.]
MNLYNRFASKIALPFFDLITNKKNSHYLSELNKSQFWSADKLHEYQNDRLKQLIAHVYANVPFYTELFNQNGLDPNQIKDVSDLKLLPILTKSDIRAGIRSGKLMNKKAQLSKLEKNNSSGSTGEPLQFFLDNDAASMKKAAAIRAWQWMGFNVGDKIFRISPLERSRLIKRIQDYFTNTLYMQSYRMNEEEFKKISEALVKFSPSILRSYPDPLYLLVRYMRSNKIKPPKITSINTTGSTLYEFYRDEIEEYFSCRIFDSFSCEGSAGASQCPQSKLYHLADEYSITEIVDITGTPSTKGRLITTDLWNYATPFIRYDTQDIVELSDDPCSCGRGLNTVKHIFGRSSDILVTPKKQYLFANNFTGYFQNYSEVDQFQIYQKSVDHMIIRIKANESYDASTTTSISSLMNQITGGDMVISFDFVDEIPVAPSGKRRFLIRDESVPLDLA